MFKLSPTRGLLSALIFAATTLPALAAPVAVDFEPGFVVLANGDTYSQVGFDFTATGSGAVIDPSFCDPVIEFCAVGNDTSFLTALNDTSISLRHNSRVFSLGSFAASFAPSPLVNLSGIAARLQLDGVNVDGDAVGLAVDLLEDGATGNFLFSTYDGSSLGLLRSLTFSVCFFDGVACGASPFLNDAQFALDDLSLTVPEPGPIWLLALTLTGLALTRRRQIR